MPGGGDEAGVEGVPVPEHLGERWLVGIDEADQGKNSTSILQAAGLEAPMPVPISISVCWRWLRDAVMVRLGKVEKKGRKKLHGNESQERMVTLVLVFN